MKTLTKGNPIKLILAFSVPLCIGRILQLFYTIVDTRIVGQFLGEEALAAVGGTGTLSDLVTDFMIGVTGGFAIISATMFGAGDEQRLKRAAASAFGMSAVISLFITFLFFALTDPILTLLHVPEGVYEEGRGYITVVIGGLLFGSLYNVCASLLRSVGDSLTPLFFLILSSAMNIGLDYGFIAGMGMGARGAAYATVISQAVAFVLCFLYMWKKYPLLRFSLKDVSFTGDMVRKMKKAGMSMGFMSAFVSMGTVSLQGAINTFGSDIIVAHAAARKITMIFMLPFGVFGQALATFCGQNMGAGEYGRIRTGLRQTIFLTWGWCLLVILTANTISPQMITMITASRNENILLNGSMYLKFDTAFYFIPTLITLVRNSLQGVGDSLTPVISSFIEFAGKILISLFLAPAIGYWGIIVAEPIVWTLMVIPLLIALRGNRVFNENAPAKGAGRIL